MTLPLMLGQKEMNTTCKHVEQDTDTPIKADKLNYIAFSLLDSFTHPNIKGNQYKNSI